MLKNIVVIGGGTGIYNILRGLKKYNVNLTAVVSMMDDGGSAGVLRDEFGILPPGDVRRCLIALSNSTKLMRELFQYRFKDGEIKNHNLGNLLITALTKITGSDENGIKAAANLLNIKGNVAPVTYDDIRLCAELENGEIIRGERNIDMPMHDPKLKIKRIFLEPKARANKEALREISFADMIIIGPGDLYTSIIPNLLVDGISEAINNSDAKKVYVCNLMTKYGETNNFTALDFLTEVEKYLNGKINCIIVNKQKAPKNILKEYAKEYAIPVVYDEKKLRKHGVDIVTADLFSEADILRHDPNKIAKLLMEK